MNTNILELNDDCIAQILQYLPIDNHMYFAQVCQRFHNVWLDYRMLVYKRLELGATTSDAFEQEVLLLSKIAPHVKHLSLNLNRNFAWSEDCRTKVVKILDRMIELEHVILWLRDTEPYESLEPILRSIEHLPNIKGILTYQDNEIADILYQFPTVESFLREAKISRNPLIEPIQSNTKIRLLVFNKASIQPILADLVQHSSSIKELNFRMTERAEEYAPLAEMPNLNKLQMFGNWLNPSESSDIMPFLTALSKNLSHQLNTLTIHVPSLGYTETLEIVRLKALQRLDCSFSDCKCLELLVRLKELTHLSTLLPISNNIDSPFLSLLENCRNLKFLQIDSPNLSRNIIPRAYNVLQNLVDSKKNSPLILMLGETAMPLDEETSKYLTVFW